VVIFGGSPLSKKTTSCMLYRSKNAPKEYRGKDYAQYHSCRLVPKISYDLKK
jgi:hypothetical protein